MYHAQQAAPAGMGHAAASASVPVAPQAQTMHGYGDGHGGVSVPMAQAVETDEQMAWRMQQQYNQQQQPPQAYAQPAQQPQAHAQPVQQPQPQPQRRTTMESQVGMWRFVQRIKGNVCWWYEYKSAGIVLYYAISIRYWQYA